MSFVLWDAAVCDVFIHSDIAKYHTICYLCDFASVGCFIDPSVRWSTVYHLQMSRSKFLSSDGENIEEDVSVPFPGSLQEMWLASDGGCPSRSVPAFGRRNCRARWQGMSPAGQSACCRAPVGRTCWRSG